VNDPAASKFVSRAGLKLDYALREFSVDVYGLVCADFGCNVGGFTDCLLQRGAARVLAIDTGYGVLAWTLRNDSRVIVMERNNALHVEPVVAVDLVVIDLAWTPQRHAIPAALRWLKPGGRIVSLVKPHYELSEEEKISLLNDGVLDPSEAQRVLNRVQEQMFDWGVRPTAHTRSPITGGKSSKGRGGEGNVEYLVLLEPVDRTQP
jgi:23S rRNA (cytidine1920-2'-O)/16S rRNA (cytidine1409-2'-O)-methyltransferase